MYSLKDLFVHPTADVVAVRQLEQARMDLLTAQHNAEHHNAQVAMLAQRVARLEQRTTPQSAPQPAQTPFIIGKKVRDEQA